MLFIISLARDNRAIPTKKKARDLLPCVHQLVGIAKRLNQMNFEETIFPRRGYTAPSFGVYIHRMSISRFCPWF